MRTNKVLLEIALTDSTRLCVEIDDRDPELAPFVNDAWVETTDGEATAAFEQMIQEALAGASWPAWLRDEYNAHIRGLAEARAEDRAEAMGW